MSRRSRSHSRFRAVLALACALLAGGGFFTTTAAAADAGPGPVGADRLVRMLEASPEPGYALEMLLELYRTHSGGLEPLELELRDRVKEKPDEAARRMVLGLVLEARGDAAGAAVAYSEAALRSPRDPRPLLAAGRAWGGAGDREAAAEALRSALKRAKGTLRRDVLRALGENALDRGALDEARDHYRALVATDPGSAHVRFELPRALAARGRLDDAIAAYRAVARGAGRDRKRAVLATMEVGELLSERGDHRAAIETYRSAMKALAPGHYLLREIEARLVEAHRRADDLRGLIDWYEGRGGASHEHALRLGRLYEEVGDDERAAAAYRRTVALKRGSAEAWERLIAVYERTGRSEELVAAYEALLRAAPGEPRHRIAFAEMLHRRHDVARAFRVLDGLGPRHRSDAAVRLRLADLYTRWDERERAREELRALLRLEPAEAAHRIALGELHWQDGDGDTAVKVWTGIVGLGDDRVGELARLAAVLAEHELFENALTQLREAEKLAPDDLRLLSTRGVVLERAMMWDRAVTAWRQALEVAIAAADIELAEKARRHLVTVHERAGTLEGVMLEWSRALEADPPDLEAGRLLALAVSRTEPDRAARILATVVDRRADPTSLATLERLHAEAGRWRDALAVAKRLVEADPGRAREAWTRIADYHANLYEDAEAIAAAERVVEVAPRDADAWRRLASLRERLRDRAGAIDAWERAWSLAPRSFDHAFALVRLHGDDPRADELLLEIIRRATDDGVVARAGRKAIRRATSDAKLVALERELLRLFSGPTARTAHRTALLELYRFRVVPLWRRASGPAPSEAARAMLAGIRERATHPLLEALGDEGGVDRAAAAEMLGMLGAKAATHPVSRLLESHDPGLRRVAALALGRIADVRAVPALSRALRDGAPALREAITWALGRVGTPAALRVLGATPGVGAADPRWSVRALAGLALGASSAARDVAVLRRLARDPDETVRRCAYWGLARSAHAAADLRERLGLATTVPERHTLLLALGTAGSLEALPDILRHVWSTEPTLRRAATRAALRLVTGASEVPAPDLGAHLDVRERVQVDALLANLEAEAAAASIDDAGARRLLLEHGDVVADAVRAALLTPDPAVRGLLVRDLDLAPVGISLGPLSFSSVTLTAADRSALEALGGSLVPVLRTLVSRTGGEERRRVERVLGKAAAHLVPSPSPG